MADEKLNRLMQVVEGAYGVDVPEFPWDPVAQKVSRGKCGDTLLEFILLEIKDTYDPAATWGACVAEAARAMRRAERDCREVAAALAAQAERYDG